jgi:hypothetical protein
MPGVRKAANDPAYRADQQIHGQRDGKANAKVTLSGAAILQNFRRAA